jgi:hypothetical protein
VISKSGFFSTWPLLLNAVYAIVLATLFEPITTIGGAVVLANAGTKIKNRENETGMNF